MSQKFGPHTALIERIAAAMLMAAGAAMLAVLMRPLGTERDFIIEALLGLMLLVGGATYWGQLSMRGRTWTEGYWQGWGDRKRLEAGGVTLIPKGAHPVKWLEVEGLGLSDEEVEKIKNRHSQLISQPGEENIVIEQEDDGYPD